MHQKKKEKLYNDDLEYVFRSVYFLWTLLSVEWLIGRSVRQDREVRLPTYVLTWDSHVEFAGFALELKNPLSFSRCVKWRKCFASQEVQIRIRWFDELVGSLPK